MMITPALRTSAIALLAPDLNTGRPNYSEPFRSKPNHSEVKIVRFLTPRHCPIGPFGPDSSLSKGSLTVPNSPLKNRLGPLRALKSTQEHSRAPKIFFWRVRWPDPCRRGLPAIRSYPHQKNKQPRRFDCDQI
jgi:hypothetical protein